MATYSSHWHVYNGNKWKLAFTAISVQIFWQHFYRNVPWVVLYQTYLFGSNLLIWLVTMATKRQNLWKIYWKINSSEAVWGIKLKLSWLFLTLASTKKKCFIAIAEALWLLWQLSTDLQWEKWKLRLIAISLQICWQQFYRNICWVVLLQAHNFGPNLSIWLVAMATEILNVWNKY